MDMLKEKVIGIFFGSRSPEHDVSIITGQLVISGLKKLGYKVVPVYISKKGKWFIGDDLGSLEFFKESDYKDKLHKYGGWSLDLEKSQKQMVFSKGGFGKKEITIDIAFPALHGSNGEDGTIQGLFELCNVPYIGCDVTSSAITIDKALTKSFYKERGILTTDFVAFTMSDWKANKNNVLKESKQINFPLFVKPARAGSSIGITKVSDEKDLEFAIDVALHYDTKALVEKEVSNMIDLTCSVIGNYNPQASLVQQSLYSEDLFSYDDKYIGDGGAQLGNAENKMIIPANIPDDVTEKVQEMSIRIFKELSCSGIARVDFLYDKESNKLYANEVNTIPGTLYHHLWKQSGLNLSALLEKLLTLSMEKYSEKNNVTSTFDSDILIKANSSKLSSKLMKEE